MIDVIEDVFNVEKWDGAIREFGDFELTLLNLTKYACKLRVKLRGRPQTMFISGVLR